MRTPNPFISVLGATIVFILFIFYGGIITYMILEVRKFTPPTPEDELVFKKELVYTVTAIGGLVSAVVIAQLVKISEGKNPAKMLAKFWGAKETDKIPLRQILIWFYLGGWVTLGALTFVFGVLVYPDINKTLNELGTTWLGMALSVGFSFFGLNPPSSEES